MSYVDVDEFGVVDPESIRELIKPETFLVSVQHANQEIGTIQDIKAISEICNDENVVFHTDATHTFTKMPLDLGKIQADMVTISAHTLHGPNGIGALYIKKGTPFNKYLDGGFQEFNKRGGLENIPGAVGFKRAVELTSSDENDKFIQMRDQLMQRVLNEIPNTTLNGHSTERIPQNANITFDYVEGESITLYLDMRGFAVSTGSACFSRSLQASHVILGIGGDPERAHGSLRITFGRFNTMDDVEAIADVLNEIVTKLREISAIGMG